MDWQKMAKRLSGLQTVSSISRMLGVSRATAINYAYEMRKRGYVAETRGKGKIRVYEISPVPRTSYGYPGLYEIINANSPVKIAKPYEHRIYHKMPIEEAIVRAIKTRDFRAILASLALFRKVQDWKLLYGNAQKEGLQRHVGALYDTARKCTRVKRMDNRIRNKLKQAKPREKFIIAGMRSVDFKDIEKEWGICVPFNQSDLGRYREVKK
ncbi:MAG: hypothetical protein HY514_00655 [Candidatus Aenigmarchaeota archaeon]|nr:hypothetical protein [Candidatus Aenigmarchaeota archaeon]